MQSVQYRKNLNRWALVVWLFVYAVAIGMHNSEQTAALKFLGWVDVDGAPTFVDVIELERERSYRVALFLQKRDRTRKEPILARYELRPVGSGAVVLAGELSSTGRSLLSPAVLGSYADQLVDDSQTDPYGRNKRLRSSSVFTVEDSGKYEVSVTVRSHPEVWKMAVLLNHDARNLNVWLILLTLYPVLFLIIEIRLFLLGRRTRWASS